MGEAKKTNKDDFSMLWGIHCLLLFFFYFFFSLGKVAASRKWRTRHKTFIKELYTSLLSHQSHFYSHLFLLSRFYHRNVYDWWCLSLSRFSTEKFFLHFYIVFLAKKGASFAMDHLTTFTKMCYFAFCLSQMVPCVRLPHLTWKNSTSFCQPPI